MKTLFGLTISLKYNLAVICVVCVVYSCSKDRPALPDKNIGNGNVEIAIAGVQDEQTFVVAESEIESQIARASIARRQVSDDENTIAAYDIKTLAEFDVLSDIQMPLKTSSSSITPIDTTYLGKTARTSKASKSSSKAVTRMESGTSYRIIFYEQGSTTVVANQSAIAGTAMQVPLDAGKTYNWYAVSINSTTVPNIDASGIIARAGLVNRDVLYSRGTITPVLGANNLDVTFDRLTARIEVDLNVRGMFGRIRNTTSLELGYRVSSSFFSVIQMGDLNILTGDYSNTSSAPAITGGNMTATSTTTGNAVKKAIFYTNRTTNIANNSLTVRLNRLDLTMDNQGTRSFRQNILVPISGALTPNYGSRYVINARLIESPAVVGSTRFARTNLIYDAASGVVDRYRFRPNNDYARPNYNGEYWRYQATTPTGSSGTIDPCSRVYPQGAWISPSINNFRALGLGPMTGSTMGGVQKITAHWSFTGGTQNGGYPDEALAFLFLGFYNPNNVLNDAAENISNGGRALADYWLRTSASITTADVARYRVTQDNNGVRTYFAVTHQTATVRTGRRPYRCMRV